jgi:hypothetical protein
MEKAVTAFLDRFTLDGQDLLAKRAIRAIEGLTGLITNAYNRGDSANWLECRQAVASAILAFAFINVDKDYAFADKVDPRMPAITAGATDLPDRAENAPQLVERAEGVYEALKDVLTPVCTFSGITSVTVLRGDHCRAAMDGLTAVNDN